MPMNAREAASHCHVTLWEIRRATEAGELKAKAWGSGLRQVAYKRSELDRWLASRPPDQQPTKPAA
jgi:hypothetical protein